MGRQHQQAPATAPPASVPAKKHVFVVAAGQSCITNRGIVDAGQPVTAADFPGGEARIADLAGGGVLVSQEGAS